MPLIMDDGLDMDELFGEEPALSLPPAPTPPALIQRLEELRLRSCCTKLAWSRLGCIAYINRGGRGLAVRSQLCSPEDGRWTLSKEQPIPPTPSSSEGQRLLHLAWNSSGSELAVVDAIGGITIYSILDAVNRLGVSREATRDHEDDLGALAGLSWLSSDRQFTVYRPANKVDGQYTYNVSNQKSLGHFPPQSNYAKSSLIGVTKGGALRLIYQLPDNTWQEAISELESISSSNDVLSHASFCPYKENGMLLVVRTVTAQYRFHRITINWNVTPGQKPNVHPSPFPSPKIIVWPVLTADSTLEDPPAESLAGNGARFLPQLSHLELLPAVISPSKHGEQSPPTLLAVFSHIREASSPDDQDTLSIAVRWELRSTTQKLHECFDQLASRKNSASSAKQQTLELHRLEEERINKLVLCIQQSAAGPTTIVTLASADGSIEFRDRDTFKAVTYDDDAQRVSSMSQVGFAFPVEEPCVETVMSPNFCLAVASDLDGGVRLKWMQYVPGSVGTSLDDPQTMTVIAALTLQSAYSRTHHTNMDDVIAIVQRYLTPDLTKADLTLGFLSEVHRSLLLSVDHSADPQYEKLFRNQVLQRCLSMQNSVGYRGERLNRAFSAKIAHVTLNLRLAALTFFITLNSGSKGVAGSEGDFKRPEVMQSLFEVIKWSIDLRNFLVDELFVLSETLRGRETDREFIQQTLLRTNSCALTLIMASMPRTFLRYNTRSLRGLSSASHKALQANHGREQRQAFTSVMDVIDNSTVKVAQLERVLAEVDSGVKSAYQGGNIDDANRGLAEKQLLIRGEIPEVLVPVVERLLTTTLNSLREEIDSSVLYFSDYRWLGLSDDKATYDFQAAHTIDSLRKVALPRDARLRRCARCCAYMEDVTPTKGTSMWVANLQKTCHCGSLWMLVGPRQ